MLAYPLTKSMAVLSPHVAVFTCFGTSVARDRADILTLLFLLKENKISMSSCNNYRYDFMQIFLPVDA